MRWPRSIFTSLLLLGMSVVLMVAIASAGLVLLRPLPGGEPVNAGEVAALLSGKSDASAHRNLLLRRIGGPAGKAETIHPGILQNHPPAGAERSPNGSEPLIFGAFTIALQQPDGSWRVVSHRPDLPFERWQVATVLWIILSVFGMIPVVWLFSDRMARPVRALAAATDRLGREGEVAPVEVRGPSEIRQAAKALNGLQARLQRYVRERTSVVGAIAHDLRTPLARLTFHLANAPAPVRRLAEAEIAEMEQMIASALEFVQNETRTQPHELLDLGLLVEGVVDDQQDLGRPVSLKISGRATVRGDPLLLKRLFANLINNAVTYGGQAEVRLWLADNHARVDVTDKGPGLMADDLLRVFEPFYRAENSRNRSTGGLGLGLAIVQSAAKAHGGFVELFNLEAAGLCARVTLPLAGADRPES